MTALLLRPQHKISQSCESFRQAGIDAVGLGLLHLLPGPDDIGSLSRHLTLLQNPLTVIVTSQAAVQQIVAGSIAWPASSHFFAVGDSTAAALRLHGINCVSPNIETSEGLLALLKQYQLESAEVWILKGQGGRNLLAQALEPICGTLRQFALYRRVINHQPIATRDWQQQEIDCIVATSGEIIEAAFKHFDHHWLRSLPWIVVSRRLVEFAATLGIETCYQSAGAQDQYLIETIKTIWSAK